MNRKWLIILGVLILLLLLRLSGVDKIIDENIKLFMDIEKEYGYSLLLLTIPLSILQGIITIFPIITIITFHVIVFGVTEGLIYSFIGGFLGSIICFILGRYLFHDWSEKLWLKKKVKYQNLERYFQQYGMWGLIVLRTTPIMPSNMISLMAALSPIPFRTYLWSSIFGNISMVWLLGILGLSVAVSEASPIVVGYIIYLLTLLVIFLIQVYYHKYKSSDVQKSKQFS